MQAPTTQYYRNLTRPCLTHIDILVPPVTLLAHGGLGQPLLREPPEGLPGQHVARTPGEVSLQHKQSVHGLAPGTYTKIFEMMSEVNGFVGVERSEEFFEIFYDHESVIISLEEPVKLVSMVLIAVLEAPLSLAPEVLPPLTDVESHRPQLGVLKLSNLTN